MKKESPLDEIQNHIKYARAAGYEILEIQAPMGDILTVTSQPTEVLKMFNYPFRTADQIALICSVPTELSTGLV